LYSKFGLWGRGGDTTSISPTPVDTPLFRSCIGCDITSKFLAI